MSAAWEDAVDATARRRGGVYATPEPLAEALVGAGLEPALRRAARARDPEAAILALRVLDPACGSGRLLVAAGRRIGTRLADVRAGGRAGPADLARGLADAVAHTLVGADREPGAADAARRSLSDLAGGGTPPRILLGDAILGATPRALALGIPDAAYPRGAAGAALRVRNRAERREVAPLPPDADLSRAAADAWSAAFLASPGRGGAGVTTGALADLASGRDHAPGLRALVAGCVAARAPVHWHLDVPEVIRPDRGAPGPGWRGGFDLVVGNPPFLNRLERATAPDPGAAALLKARHGAAAGGYADAAAVFLLAALELTRPGGRVALLLPQAILASRGARAARDAVCAAGALEWLWVAGERTFPARVLVAGAVVRRGGSRRTRLRRAKGPDARPLPAREVDMDALAHEPTWWPLVADALGVPAVAVAGAGVLGDLCVATAGFRQHHYGLLPALVEDEAATEDLPALVTCGLVDPGRCLWGRTPARIGGRLWTAPRVDPRRIADPRVSAWARDRLVPKVVLATQTRVLEVAVDAHGEWLPATPLVAVAAHPRDLWRVAAVLAAPPVSAIAMARHGGSGLSADTIRLPAREVAGLPCPADASEWAASARALRDAASASDADAWRAALEAAAAHACAAYGITHPEGLLEWWRRRLPPWRGPSGYPPEDRPR